MKSFPLACIAVVLLLGACAQKIEEEVGQCEPGVENISEVQDVMPEVC